MKNLFVFLLFVGLVASRLPVCAQVTLGEKSKIVLSERTDINRTAAAILQDFVQKICGLELPVKERGKASVGDVLIGGCIA